MPTVVLCEFMMMGVAKNIVAARPTVGHAVANTGKCHCSTVTLPSVSKPLSSS